jgi:hypothetical protein
MKMAGFATEHLAEQELADVQVVAVIDARGKASEAFGKPLSEARGQAFGEHRAVLVGGTELFDDPFLGFV